MKLDTKEFEHKMKMSIESLRQNLNTVRAGKANPEAHATGAAPLTRQTSRALAVMSCAS